MKTAIEFFNDGLYEILELYPSEWQEIKKLFNKAKQMEKEQIEIAFEDGQCNACWTGEIYYNETYKNTNE